MPRRPVPLETRFWNMVDKSNGDGCWEWLGAIHKVGYGAIGSGTRPSRALYAHRVSWELHNGAIPEGQLVCHTCDNRKCVNPDHMFLGTHKDNQRDMAIKGRGVNILNPPDIPRIRKMLDDGFSTTVIGRKFGVTPGTISSISRGVSWAWIK